MEPVRPDPEDLLRAIDERWERLRPSLESLEDEDPDGTWSVTDVYAHLARWSDATSGAVRAHVDREPTAEFDRYFDDYRRWNAIWAEEDSGAELGAARDAARSSHGRLMLTLRSLNREDWDRYVVDIASDVRDHYQAHLDAPLEFETRA